MILYSIYGVYSSIGKDQTSWLILFEPNQQREGKRSGVKVACRVKVLNGCGGTSWSWQRRKEGWASKVYNIHFNIFFVG